MERQDILELMGTLKLYGMRAAFDEIIANGVKRQHAVQRILADLLKAEIDEKQARSIKYQMTIAKLLVAKDLREFEFEGSPVNETLVRGLATGAFLAQQRNAVLVGGTGTGKTHLAIAIARSCIRTGARGRFYNVVDLVNKLEAEARAGRQGRIADHLTRLDFVVLDELGYLPFALSGGQLVRRENDSLDRFLVRLTPRDQPALRADLGDRDDEPRLRRVAKRLLRSEMTAALLDRLTHHCDIIETGNESWRFKNREAA